MNFVIVTMYIHMIFSLLWLKEILICSLKTIFKWIIVTIWPFVQTIDRQYLTIFFMASNHPNIYFHKD